MLSVDKPEDALAHFFDFHFNRLGIGLVMTITGNQNYKFGVGKSYTAMKIAELLDEDFREGTKGLVKIVHTPKDFLKAMEYIEAKGKRGQVMIIDEAGLLVNARQWHSLINKAMSDVVMTFRVLKCLAIFITPSLSVIDKNIRMFTNVWGITEKVVWHGQQRVRLRPYKMAWDNYEFNKYYRKNIAMYLKDRKRVAYFKYFWISLPKNKELLEAYELKAAEYKRQVRKDIQNMGTEQKSIEEYVDDAVRDAELHHVKGKTIKVYPEEIKMRFAITKNDSAIIARKANVELKKRVDRGELSV